MSAADPGARITAQQLRQDFDAAFAAPFAERYGDSEPYLTLRVDAAAYALPVLDVAGFALARKIVPLASTLPSMLGLTAVRGALWPVYSLERLLHGSASEPPRWFVLCRGVDPVAFGFAHFEGHVLLPRGARFAAGEGEGRRRHVRELVRAAGQARGVIDVSSLVESVREGAGATVKER